MSSAGEALVVTIGRLAAASLPLALILLLSGAPTALAQQPAPPTAPGSADPPWFARYDFALEVDGKPSPDACFYQERNGRRILISAPEVSKVCIITQDGMKVTAVERSKVKLEQEGES